MKAEERLRKKEKSECEWKCAKVRDFGLKKWRRKNQKVARHNPINSLDYSRDLRNFFFFSFLSPITFAPVSAPPIFHPTLHQFAIIKIIKIASKASPFSLSPSLGCGFREMMDPSELWNNFLVCVREKFRSALGGGETAMQMEWKFDLKLLAWAEFYEKLSSPTFSEWQQAQMLQCGSEASMRRQRHIWGGWKIDCPLHLRGRLSEEEEEEA